NDTVDNSFHVMVITNVPAGNDSLIVDGITFTKGNASNPNSTTVIGLFIGQYIGGGMVISQVSDNTAIRNCTIKDNYGIFGAGMVVAGGIDFELQQFLQATPGVSNCLFDHNVTILPADGSSGIGIYGGALVNIMASPIISNCSFIKNEGKLSAAISNSYNSSPVIIGTSFTENKASGASVIMNMDGSNTIMANCRLTDNINIGLISAPGDDETGAVDLNEILGNAVIANAASSSIRIINSTISRNYSAVSPSVSGGNILNMNDSKLFITNSVIWDNQSTKIVDSSGSTTQVAYSLVQGLPADPLDHNLDGTIDYSIFVDAPNGDYQLNMASPAINAGLNDTLVNALMAYNGGDPDGGVDLAGNPRILESVVDLGAFEFVRSALPVKMGELKGSIDKVGHAILRWPTYTEANNKGFQVQESSDGVKFVNSHFVPSLGRNGNSSAPLLYSFDAGAISGVRYFRLRQLNYNGSSTGSNVIRLQEANTRFHLTAYPNPARNNINVHVEGKMAANPRIIVVDFSGRVLISRELTGSDAKVDLSSLAAGIYLIKYVDDNQSTVIRIVKQ
ncbi:MAG TPA: T9SS type A sorting domain-containing protein, partial [Arachidicoccus sp.]|nr:T9SS type A sorting domain-containing protein [Arachidicoccus sp.]